MSIPLPSENYNRWDKYRKLRIIEGTWQPFVDPQPAIDHIANLRGAGMSPRSIAIVAGLPLRTVAPLAWPNHPDARTQIRPATRDAILAVRVDIDRIPTSRLVAAIGTQRRLKALCVIGWTMQGIADELGVSLSVMARSIAQGDKVTAGRAREVRDLYERLSLQRGPSDLCARRSVLKGWAPPAAWDPDTIDDPAAVPQHDVRLNREQVRDEARRLVAVGEDVQDVAEQLGCSVRTVERAIERVEREVA